MEADRPPSERTPERLILDELAVIRDRLEQLPVKVVADLGAGFSDTLDDQLADFLRGQGQTWTWSIPGHGGWNQGVLVVTHYPDALELAIRCPNGMPLWARRLFIPPRATF